MSSILPKFCLRSSWQLLKTLSVNHNRSETFHLTTRLCSSSSFNLNKSYKGETKSFKFNHRSKFTKFLISSCVIGASLYSLRNLFSDSKPLTVEAAIGIPADHPNDLRKFNFIADVAEKVLPAVVFIEVKGRHPVIPSIVTLSSGSGFIIDPKGLILTNAHVVANSRDVNVKLHDGTVIKGYVEFVDEGSDLATIRVNSKNLPFIKLGDSEKLRPGEWVIAVGSPLSFSNSVTAGVVSCAQRTSSELGLRNSSEYIQTDATITIGNSGGPLVNLNGEAIGINTMKVASGISFALPSKSAIKFLEQANSRPLLGKKPIVERRKYYIGITMLTLNETLINQLKNMDANFPNILHGVLVVKIVLGSPANM